MVNEIKYLPLIHKLKKIKQRDNHLPLYIEQPPLPPIKKVIEEEVERGVVIIEMF